jgi:A/G-specific adenine glycosylase
LKHKPGLMISAALIQWFHEVGKDYPWRRTRDPYAILVSEVMLQQTQIATVLQRGYYTRWMHRFPDFQSLAAASETDVLQAWEGLGYYRRARNLQKLAQVIQQQHGGRFPTDPAVILSLPGIGPYTAGAICSFAYGLPEPVVDGNVARVLMRLENDATPVDSKAGQQKLWARARDLVQVCTDPRALNSALMELGQTHCRPGVPDCEPCPVRPFCRATAPEKLPVKSQKQVLTAVTERVFFHRTTAGVLLEQEQGSRRTGLWKLPALPAAETPAPILLKSSYGITRYKVTLWVHDWQPQTNELAANQRFIPETALLETPMPSPYRRALTQLLQVQQDLFTQGLD